MKNQYVILLHGICDNKLHMYRIEKYLKTHNLKVININYPSTKHSMEELADLVWEKASIKIVDDNKIHMVGYSMGGLLARIIISKYSPTNLGRVVQLASPNKGSEVADYLKGNSIYKKIFGPAGQQLITDQKDINHLFKKINYELGVIAGEKFLDPISSYIIKQPNDGKVSIESTKVNGMKEHLVVKSGHMFFPYRHDVMRQTLHFLKHGKFKR